MLGGAQNANRFEEAPDKCRSGRENLCPRAYGGFAEYAVVPEAFAYRLPEELPDAEAAPLLCSGIIGYRALRRANLRTAGSASTGSAPART